MVQKSEKINELIKAVCRVMKAVDGVEKNSQVGTGGGSYKGTSDKDVKVAFKNAMAENGLAIFVIDIDDTVEIERWQEEQTYQNKTTIKQKKEVFSKAKVTYLLAHESDQWIQTTGLGYGIDSQDKGAGKCTTYALKYNLLYQFLTPVGDIDDTDTTHSNEHPIAPSSKLEEPPKELVKGSPTWDKIVQGIENGTLKSLEQIKVTVPKPLQKEIEKLLKQKTDTLPELIKDSTEWETVLKYISEGKLTSISKLLSKFKISKELQKELQKELDDYENDKILQEQVYKEQQQEQLKEKDQNRLPNLTEEAFNEAMNLTDKKAITKILNEHRMGSDYRDRLTSKLK